MIHMVTQFDEDGNINSLKKQSLIESAIGDTGTVIGVNDSSSDFLKYLDKVGISIGTQLNILDKNDFDGSLDLKFGEKTITISPIAAENIAVVID